MFHRASLCRGMWLVCVPFLWLTVTAAPGWAATATSTTLIANPASTVAFQHPVQLVATVKDGSGNPVTKGTVNFYADKALLGTVHLMGNGNNGLTVGSATLWTRLLTVGTHSLTATYNGITAFSPSTSSGQSFIVTAAAGPYPSETVLTSNGNTNGQYDLTAIVGGFGPASLSGSVTLSDTTAGIVLGTNTTLSGQPPSLIQLPPSSLLNLCPSKGGSGDFNNDGVQDLVVAGSQLSTFYCDAPPVLRTLLGNGDGTFVPGPTLPFSGSIILVADFNGDGDLDVYDGSNIYLGNGDGSFRSGGSGPPSGNGQSTIVVGDLNGDGIPDLIIGTVGMNSSLVEYLGRGDGTFNAAITISFAVDPSQFPGYDAILGAWSAEFPSTSLAVGDLNHDGMDDVVVNAGTVLWVFLSTDDTTAPSVSSYPDGNTAEPGKVMEGVIAVNAGQTATSLALKDLNGDGNLDAVIGSPSFGGSAAYPSQVNVLLGDGTGSFTEPSPYPVGTSTSIDGIFVGDFNYDANLDVMVFGQGAVLLPGDGTGGLGSAVPSLILSSTNPSSNFKIPVASDFLSDGNDDPIVFASRNNRLIAVLHAASAAGWMKSQVTLPGHGPQIVTASYSGDSNFAASTSNPVTLDTRTPVTVSLINASSSSTSVFPGYSVTIKATVAGPQGDVSPTGTVQFYNGSIALGNPVALSGATASYSLSFPNLGSQSLTAAYSGDSTYQTTTSAPLVISVVNHGQPTLSLSSESSFSPYGSPVAMMVILETIPGPAPTGTVSLTFDGNSVGQDTLSGTQPISLPFTWNPSTHPSVGQHAVTASYSGDANWSGTTTPFIVFVQSTTALSISSTGSGTVASGTPIQITGRLTTASPGPAPTGTVSLLDNGAAIATSTLAGNPPFALSFTVDTAAQPLSAGAHVFSLKFTPQDLNWQASTSPNLSVTVMGASTVVLSSNLPSTLVALPGTTVQFTSTVTPIGNTIAPTGTVEFYDGTAAIGAPVAVLNGTAAFTSTTFAAGSHSVTAAYSGDANYPGSTSAAIAFTVPTKGTVSVTPQIPAQIFRGNPVGVSVKVAESPAALGPAPTGTVTLLNASGGTIGSGAMNAQGVASITLDPTSSIFSLGANAVTAQYSGDSLWTQSTSAPVAFQLVLGQPVFSAFSCSASSPDAAGASFSCVATFAASWSMSEPAPTNPVNLVDNGTVIATKTLTGSSPYAIAFTVNSATSPLASGTHALSMSFAQDTHWLSATTAAVTVTVSADIPTFALTSNLGSFGSVVQGTTITFTATAIASNQAGVPTGTVQFYVDGSAAGTPVAMSGGVANYPISSLAPGNHTVTAAYSGDTHYHSTTTNGVVSVVTQGPDSLSLVVAGPTTVNAGTPITINGTLVVGALGPPPTGTASLFDGNAEVATTALSGNAPVNFSFNVNTPSKPLAAGTHSFSLKYGGETHWAASASVVSNINVTQSLAATTTAVSSTQSAVPAGSSVTLTAAVSSSQSTPGTTGTVQFYDGAITLGPAQTLTSGVASYTAGSLAAGSHSITAVYSGDANYKASTSAALTVEIQDFALQSSAPNLSVNPGGTVTVQLQVTAEGGLDAATKFTCLGMPAASTCTVSPSQVTGSGSVTATITTTSSSAAANHIPPGQWLQRGEIAIAGLMVLILPLSHRRGRPFLWMIVAFLGMQVLLQGCGGGSGGTSSGGGGKTGTPAGTYTVTVTGTANSGNTTLTHSVQVKLTVN